jgi:hypothetical protein
MEDKRFLEIAGRGRGGFFAVKQSDYEYAHNEEKGRCF